MTDPVGMLQPPQRSFLIDVAAMRRLEQQADAAGHSYAAMMEAAGQAVARHLLERCGTAPALLLCGPGNNGGDGLVCARHLHDAGAPVRVLLCGRPAAPAPGADPHLERLHARGIQIATFDAASPLAARWLEEAAVWVDALLGTGVNRPIEGDFAALLQTVRATAQSRSQKKRPAFTVAVDCPSGLHCDSGAADPLTPSASLTVTFAFAKPGHYRFPGAAHCGEISVAAIGIPAALLDEVTQAPQRTFVLDAEMLSACLPQRSNNSHKGSFGKLMVAAGSVLYPGAVALACRAGGRVGAGLVTGALPRPVWPVAASRLMEPTWQPLPARDGALDAPGAPRLLAALEGYTALVVGCGLSPRPGVRAFLDALLNGAGEGRPLPPTLIDADGLNALAQSAGWPARLRAAAPRGALLTPHAAELGRLLNLPVAEVTARRWELARQAAAEWGVYLLAKGPYTVIAAPDGALAVLPIATPALATAGTGDVLAGAIGGLLAQGLPLWEAACLGAWLHGQAGLLAAAEIGLAGVVAGDVAERLPAVLRTLRDANMN